MVRANPHSERERPGDRKPRAADAKHRFRIAAPYLVFRWTIIPKRSFLRYRAPPSCFPHVGQSIGGFHEEEHLSRRHGADTNPGPANCSSAGPKHTFVRVRSRW